MPLTTHVSSDPFECRRCPVTGRPYVTGIGSLERFAQPHCLFVHHVEKISRRRKQRRVVLVTYQRLIVCDEQAYIRRFQSMYGVQQILWKELPDAVQLVVQIQEKDVLLRFSRNVVSPEMSYRTAAFEFIDMLDTIRRCQVHLGPDGDAQGRAAALRGEFADYAGTRRLGPHEDLREQANLRAGAAYVPPQERLKRRSKGGPASPTGVLTMMACPTAAVHSLPLFPAPPVGAPRQGSEPPCTPQRDAARESIERGLLAVDQAAKSSPPTVKAEAAKPEEGPAAKAAGGDDVKSEESAAAQSDSLGSPASGLSLTSAESPVLGKYTRQGLVLLPSDGPESGISQPAGAAADTVEELKRQLDLQQAWGADLEQHCIALRATATWLEAQLREAAEGGSGLDGVHRANELRDELVSLRLSGEVVSLTEQAARLKAERDEEAARASECAIKLAALRAENTRLQAELEEEQEKALGRDDSEFMDELVRLRRSLAASAQTNTFSAALAHLCLSESELVSLEKLSVRAPEHLAFVTPEELQTAGLTAPCVRRLSDHFGYRIPPDGSSVLVKRPPDATAGLRLPSPQVLAVPRAAPQVLEVYEQDVFRSPSLTAPSPSRGSVLGSEFNAPPPRLCP
eukprot:TRINITY_DN37574_c0_g1_i1.p1 TRINITY_DN37574_c0_g1~~TRINITY_DN37574_c0_g1_i1.p1  ORF type:complete len:627 (+),score=173.85 TRINITY_DN37574_c0_g1_i1:53-1933(+)